MKKFALALMASAAAVFGFGLVANAQYPPGSLVTVSTPTPGPGSSYTVTATGCQPGESMTFTQGASSDTSTCAASGGASFTLFATASGGTATGTLTAPTAAGTYTGTVTGNQGFSGTFQITVSVQTDPGGGLPATGSDGISTTTMIAGGLLIVGLGLFGVATFRRRHPITA